jgi:hypothetical protein
VLGFSPESLPVEDSVMMVGARTAGQLAQADPESVGNKSSGSSLPGRVRRRFSRNLGATAPKPVRAEERTEQNKDGKLSRRPSITESRREPEGSDRFSTDRGSLALR